MVSPDDIIEDEPDRFAERLDTKKIKKAKDSQTQFLKEMEKKWNQKGGLYLWRYLIDKYKLMNTVYTSKNIQQIMRKQFKGDLNKEIFEKFIKKFQAKSLKVQKRIESKRQELIDAGKKIKRHSYSPLQTRFILSKKRLPLKWLSYEFNKSFNTKLSRTAIRDKRLRLLGKKK